MALNRSIIWTDVGGNTTITLIRTVSGGATIQSNIQLVSNADFVNEWEGGLNVNPTPSPTNAQYPGVGTQATLIFACADGSSARLDIPSPMIGMFLPDGVTVDPSTIPSLIASCIGVLASTSLSHATAYQSGFLRRRP